jgi:hypothetical protein
MERNPLLVVFSLAGFGPLLLGHPDHVLHLPAKPVRVPHHPVEPAENPVHPLHGVLFGPARLVTRPDRPAGGLGRQILHLVSELP